MAYLTFDSLGRRMTYNPGAEVVVSHEHVVVSFAGERRQVASGTTVEQFLEQILGTVPQDILAALVNRRMVMLDYPLLGFQVDLEAVRASSREGEAVARQSACLILLEAVRELYPEARIAVGQSLGGGYFFSWHAPTPLTPQIDVPEVPTQCALQASVQVWLPRPWTF